MSDFEHGTSPELELSEETLVQLRDELAKVLVLRGKPGEYTDVYPVGDGKPPRDFTYPLDPEFLQQTYFPHDDNVIVDGGEISYFTAHRLEKEDRIEDGVDQGIFLIIKSRLSKPTLPPASQLHMDSFFRIGGYLSDEHVTGYSDTEYSQNGKSISPNNIPRKSFYAMDEDEMRAFFQDQLALRRSLTLEDAERLAKVADYIESQPKID